MTPAVALPVRASPFALHRHGEIAHPERGLARGELVRVVRGVYADAAEWRRRAPWERYLARVHAVAMLHPDAIFSHESAAALLGLPVIGDPVVVHVLGPATTAARVVNGIRIHTTNGERELLDRGGITTTSPVETAVDMARHRHPALALAVADAVLHASRGLAPQVLVARNEARASSRGRNLARWPLERADPLSESTLESLSRATIEWLGFPPPLLQVVFRSEGKEDRTDFHWAGASLAGEADGDVKYDGSYGAPLAALRDRRERDIRLGTHVRAITHWGWLEATTFEPLRNILLGAGLPLVERESTAQLLSLRRQFAPRSAARGPRDYI